MNYTKHLLAGFQRFNKRFVKGKSAKYQSLANNGQNPKALVIACCDSRVDPALILDCKPGDLFVVRNVANIVPPYNRERTYASTSAALEFGILSLHIPQVIVLGHSRCAGIKAALDKAKSTNTSEHSSIDQWMSNAKTAAEETLQQNPQLPIDEQLCICSRKSLIKSVSNLKSYPWVKEGISTGKLEISTWYFNLANASLEEYNEVTEQFERL